MSTHRPRYRYIAFRVEGDRPFRRDEVLDALHALRDPLWLVGFQDPKGLVRCTHLRKDATIEALKTMATIAGIPVRVTTLGTSGTIRRATEKYLS
ncbi:MAG TPA: Rpp14/Pop5 family protein [Thermoplasmata archaeon]|nr:Rpp14/Pop5 family protein [Thermoplasmata archaeon]